MYLKQLAMLRRRLARRPDVPSPSWLATGAQAAFELGDYDKALSYANKSLASLGSVPASIVDTISGESVFWGHTIRGRLALRTGDAATARRELLLAGKSNGSPAIRTFGPNMRLVRDLLNRDGANQEDWDAARVFLENCDAFWPSNSKELLVRWQANVRAGEIPEFYPGLLR